MQNRLGRKNPMEFYNLVFVYLYTTFSKSLKIGHENEIWIRMAGRTSSRILFRRRPWMKRATAS